MSEKLSVKERLELSIHLMNAQNLIEIRDLLKEIRMHQRFGQVPEHLQEAGMNDVADELEQIQFEELPRVLEALSLQALLSEPGEMQQEFDADE